MYAAQDKNKPIAIIVPGEGALKSLAKQNGIESEDFKDMCQDKKLNDLVLKELQAQGKKGGLAGIEIIEGVVMTDEEWTPQNVSAPYQISTKPTLTCDRAWLPLLRS